ncbi:MAG: hypothetical protein GY898_14210 [Proteobacteria bacterium]|nr:hypothetical protein [Pseudomonadota bacterium]
MLRKTMLLALALAALTACEEADSSVVLAVCNPILDDLDPGIGPVDGGTQVTVNGLFVATDLGVRDVTVFVGGAEAEVTGAFRGSGCTNCDACVAEALRCAECERVCRGDASWTDPDTEEHFAPEVCEEWISFVTPEAVEAGSADILVSNAHGSSQELSFEYED